MDASSLPQFMTASIPYNEQLRAMDNATICTLNKRELGLIDQFPIES